MFTIRRQLRRKITTQRGICNTSTSYAPKEILPSQTQKVFLPNSAKKPVKQIIRRTVPFGETRISHRANEVNIQTLSSVLYQKIFKGVHRHTPDPFLIESCLRNLQKHGMAAVVKEGEQLPDVDFTLPDLFGNNLIEHFHIIGEHQAKPYRELVLKLLEQIPPKPTTWIMQAGWIRYTENAEPEIVPYPLEDCLVFDVEVCMKAGKTPTLATAVSTKAWYGWVSQSVLDGTSKPVTSHEYLQEALIPLETKSEETGLKFEPGFRRPKVVIGHNVSYDRARIKEQYWLERSGMRFVDTMSLHVAVGGLTSYQRAVLKSAKPLEEDEEWQNCSSLNNLSDVHKLYCGTELEKSTRDIFVEGSLGDVKENFQEVMNYCSGDVQATYDVLKQLFPLFLERFPHPVTFAGMLELSTAYLPVNSNWSRYIEDSEQAYEDLDMEARFILAQRADQACQLLHDNKFKEDIWMWDQDWDVKQIKLRKTIPKSTKIDSEKQPEDDQDEEVDLLRRKFSYLEETRYFLPAVKTHLPGYPNWYRKLCTKPDSSADWVPGPHLISTSMQVTPKLLGLTWEGYPLHFIRGLGWGFLVPFAEDADVHTKLPLRQLIEKYPVGTSKSKEASAESVRIDRAVEENLSKREYYSRLKKDKTDGAYKGSGVWCDTVLEDSCWFFKLPHKDGASHRVGNPLAKDFLSKFSESVLAGDTASAEKVLSIARMLSYWRNNRDRIMEQMVVWLNENDLPKRLRDGRKYGAIVPQVVVSGTLTRRAVEPTWMTASNAHPERIGSELRAMVQTPPGYNIVGADVDSQELWIASVIGDASFAKMHGATPFGWMTLSGTKTDGTDMHSVTAKAVGISREHAKVINYARIYGAGQNFAEQLLKQFNPSMSESEARNKATKMFAMTKGKRVFSLKPEYVSEELPDKPYGRWQAFEIAKSHGKSVSEMFFNPKWFDGTESAMFNRLEEIASDPEPKTPFLGCRLSRALETKAMPGERFLPTKVNWVVQSGAVDFLHLMLVCMRWLMHDRARFCLSFHDEVRYLVPEDYRYQAALAMHLTNLLTRSFCAIKLGMDDLPQSVAFFSSVEVDTVLRKDSGQNCKTPSNPHGLDKGYEIGNGESLDVYKAIEKAGGTYVWWGRRNVKSHKTQTRPDGGTPR